MEHVEYADAAIDDTNTKHMNGIIILTPEQIADLSPTELMSLIPEKYDALAPEEQCDVHDALFSGVWTMHAKYMRLLQAYDAAKIAAQTQLRGLILQMQPRIDAAQQAYRDYAAQFVGTTYAQHTEHAKILLRKISALSSELTVSQTQLKHAQAIAFDTNYDIPMRKLKLKYDAFARELFKMCSASAQKCCCALYLSPLFLPQPALSAFFLTTY